MVQMARDKLMPRASAEPLHYPASKAIFPELFKELADDVRLWLDAELALAKAEAGLRLRGYATGLIMALLGASLFIVAMVVLAQACVSTLVPYVSSQAVAGVIVGVGLLAVVVVFGLIARHLLLRKTSSSGLIFRWLSGNASESGLK
jgi:hypothetical protein